jgi:hypothetical protein
VEQGKNSVPGRSRAMLGSESAEILKKTVSEENSF